MVLGSWNPKSTICLFGPENGLFNLPKHRSKGKMAKFEAKNTVKQGKKRQKDKWYTFHVCTLTPSDLLESQAPICWSLENRDKFRVHTKGVMQQHATLRRALRRFSNSNCFLEGFLKGACRCFQ